MLPCPCVVGASVQAVGRAVQQTDPLGQISPPAHTTVCACQHPPDCNPMRSRDCLPSPPTACNSLDHMGRRPWICLRLPILPLCFRCA